MSHGNGRGVTERGLRSSALWGTGGRGGDSRSSVLWGKGGRSLVVTCIALCAFVVPLAAGADTGKKTSATFVAKGLLDKAKSNPGEKVDVIVQSADGVSGAENALKGLGSVQRRLGLIGAVTASMPAAEVARLKDMPGLTVTPDARVKLAETLKSSQLWPYETGNDKLWAGDQSTYVGKTPAIAIVDSGVQKRSDFGTRIVASVNLSTLDGNSTLDDERGHGTFVAGIAAGAAPDLAGAAPVAPIVSIKVMDRNGQAKTSDVIDACRWILENKGRYNIRVANFSLHSSYGTNFYRDPLDRAVEKLWFNDVTVVAASGNYGSATGASGVKYSPGNDPFVITVGALDIGGSQNMRDDAVAPWSAYGYTYDGFYKPEVAAPGRYMVGPVPSGSTLAVQKADRMVGSDRIQLSGTSFAAPVVAGSAAQLLARHPEWGPDQVKGALMKTARRVHNNPRAAGVGEITISRAATTQVPPNPNLVLEKYLTSDGSGGLTFDAISWSDKAKTDLSWNSQSWNSQSWSDLSWADQSWSTISWADISWTDMSWVDMSWVDLSWAESSQEDAAEGDTADGGGYALTPEEAAAAAADPDLNVPVDGTLTTTLP